MTASLLFEHMLAGLGATGLMAAAGYGVVRDRKGLAAERQRWQGKPRALIARSNHTYIPQETQAWLARLMHFRRSKEERFAKGRLWFSFRIEKDEGGEVWFWLIVPDDRIQGVEGTLLPTLEWHEVAENAGSSLVPMSEQKARMWVTAKHDLLPFARPGKADPLVTLLRAMGPGMAVEISFSPMDGGEAFERVRRAHAKVDPEAVRTESGTASTREAFAEIGRQTLAELGAALTGRPAKTSPQRSPGHRTQTHLLPHQRARVQGILQRYEELDELFEVTIRFEGEDPKRSRAWFQGMLGALRDIAAENG